MAPKTLVSKLVFQPGLTFCFEYKGFFSDFSARLLGLKVIAPKIDRETYYRIETSLFLSFTCMNVTAEPISEILRLGHMGRPGKKNSFNLLVPSLSLGTRLFILAIC